MRIMIAIMVLLAWANLVYGDETSFVVVNKIESKQRFTVVNKATQSRQFQTMRTVGCACSKGYNCSAGFCKANGGTGCPNTCPINGIKSSTIEEVTATDQNGNKVKVLVEGRVNPNRDGAFEQSYPRPGFGAANQSGSMFQSYSNCPNGNCASPSFSNYGSSSFQRSGWYLGKNLGR